MKWRWLWVIKNRKGFYLGGVSSNKNHKAKYVWTSKITEARLFTKEQYAIACCRKVQQSLDHTAYVTKGTFEISEHA